VNPLRDLWEGASPGRQELPWTRKERKGRRKEKKDAMKRYCFVDGKMSPPSLCDVLNE